MLSSLSWFRQHVSDNATPCAHAVERASDNSWRRTVDLHSKALHGNPFDGHTLGSVVADMERVTGVEVARVHVDKGYRGHNYPNKFKVWISGQVRRVTKTIRREMKRRAAVEPIIGHIKAEHWMDRNYLKGREGDRINAVLAAAGYNFSLLLRWLRLLCQILRLPSSSRSHSRLKSGFFTGDLVLGNTIKGLYSVAIPGFPWPQ
jgi:IS5 family transposase